MDNNVVVTQVTVSALIVAFINWLKSTSLFPKIVTGKTWLIRGISILLSLAGGLGIHTVWTAAADGTHTLMITGLSVMTILASLWVSIKQFTLTELIHRTTKPTSNPQFVAAMAPKVAREEHLIPDKEDTIGRGR